MKNNASYCISFGVPPSIALNMVRSEVRKLPYATRRSPVHEEKRESNANAKLAMITSRNKEKRTRWKIIVQIICGRGEGQGQRGRGG